MVECSGLLNRHIARYRGFESHLLRTNQNCLACIVSSLCYTDWMYTSIQLIKDIVTSAREVFEGTIADLTPKMAHQDPGGKAMTIAGAYAHLVFSEDYIIHGMLQKTDPLYKTDFANKTGASALMPNMSDQNFSQQHEEWYKTIKLDLPKFREYSQAVYIETDKYVDSLNDSDLEQVIELEWGNKTIAYLLYSYIAGHTNNLAGEVSALKGVLGSKGYTF